MKNMIALIAAALATAQVYALDCPSMDDVKSNAAALDQVTPFPRFIVFSSQPAIDDGEIKWFLQTFVKAEDENDAVNKAREATENVEEQMTPEPIEYRGVLLCSYATSEKTIVNTVSLPIPGGNFTPIPVPYFK